MLLACMSSSLTILHWTANWYALPWKDISPVFSFPWLPIVLCKVEVSWAFPSLLQHVHWGCLCSAYIWAVMKVRHYGYNFCHHYETQSHRKPPNPLALTLCPPLLQVP